MSDHHSPEYKAIDWLLSQDELEVASTDCPTWDSMFGVGYAMYLVRHHLGFADWDLVDGVSGICKSWSRVHCNDHQQVTQLIFNNANLTGSIPTELAGLKHLEHLYFNTNHQLGGSLPSEIGSLTNLRTLHLQQTRLAGPIPTEMGKLTELEQLMIYDTDFYGTFPDEVCALRSIGRLNDIVVSCHSALLCSCATHCKSQAEMVGN
ncbi:hypothetical protein MPSEU_000582500 [Mayamaea pseudoterrestris]|nr:hypothetical protein MPSEU_000582500 [Mayamaea pseudoterrestris]